MTLLLKASRSCISRHLLQKWNKSGYNFTQSALVARSYSNDTSIDISKPLDLSQSIDSSLVEPSFQSLGLASGYPSGWMQSMMETIHVQLDIPWWGTIIASTFIVRAIAFPILVKTQKTIIDVNEHQPAVQKLQMVTMKTKMGSPEYMEANRELQEYMAKHNISPLRTYASLFLNGAIFASMFFALRGMAEAPVPSLTTGGLFWFTDLTTSDPYFLLPVLTSATLYSQLKLGGDGVNLDTMPKFMTKVFLAMPLVMLPFMAHFPTALNLYWLTSNIISVGQAKLLSTQVVRDKLGLRKMTKWKPEDLPVNQMMEQNLGLLKARLQQPENVTPKSSTKVTTSETTSEPQRIRTKKMKE